MTNVEGPVSGGAPAEPSSPLLAYLDVLRARWRLVVAIFVLTVTSAVVFTSWQIPVYQASATVLIEPESPRVVNIPEVASERELNSQEYYATQYKVLLSRPVIEPVIQRLNLKQRMPHVGASADPYLALLYRRLGGVIIEPLKNTRLVLVKFEDPNPALAQEIANEIANQYVKYGLEIKHAEAQRASVWLSEQIQSLRSKAQQSSQALEHYQAKADLLGLQEQRQITQAKLIDYNRTYLEAQNQRVTSE